MPLHERGQVRGKDERRLREDKHQSQLVMFVITNYVVASQEPDTTWHVPTSVSDTETERMSIIERSPAGVMRIISSVNPNQKVVVTDASILYLSHNIPAYAVQQPGLFGACSKGCPSTRG
jgi:hypothetical protein